MPHVGLACPGGRLLARIHSNGYTPIVLDMPGTQSRNTITANEELHTNFLVLESLHIASEELYPNFIVLESVRVWSHTMTGILRVPKLCLLR